MVAVTSVLTGLVTALLRSLLAVILVAFLIAVVFLMAFLVHGALWIDLAIAIACFNGGLILAMTAYVVARRNTHSA